MRRTLTPSNSPMSSPSKHGDRFIPSRAGANWSINFHRINVSFTPFSCSSALELRKWYLLFWLAWLLCLPSAPCSSAAPEEFHWVCVLKPYAPCICYFTIYPEVSVWWWHVSPLQENEKSPSQNRKAKDATSDTGKGETTLLLFGSAQSSYCKLLEKLRQCWYFHAYAKTHAGVLGNAHIMSEYPVMMWVFGGCLDARGCLYALVYCVMKALSWWSGRRGNLLLILILNGASGLLRDFVRVQVVESQTGLCWKGP